jgi:hypothetical protein
MDTKKLPAFLMKGKDAKKGEKPTKPGDKKQSKFVPFKKK